MNAVEAAKLRHPSARQADGHQAVCDQPEPYERFLGALEDLAIAKSLYGPLSPEVVEARAVLNAAREVAAVTWRSQATAA